MMKTKKYIVMAAAAAMFSMSACDDGDFLTEDPRTIYTTENSYETVDQVKASITNMYVHIRYWYQINLFMKGAGSDVLDTPYFRCTGNGHCNFASWSSSSNYSNQIYNALYQLVNYANQTLDGYNKEGLAWENDEQKQEAFGEIMFFRGYGYLTLAELFGGVPLVDSFNQTLKLDFVRVTREETYNFAIKDLEAAVAALPNYPSEAGRIAKGAAYHFLSEAYLALAIEKGNDKTALTSAIDYADKAIALHPLMTQRFGSRSVSGAALNGIDSYYEDGNVFFDLFQRGNYDYSEGNTEALWTLQNDYTVYHEFGGNNYVGTPRDMSAVLRDVIWAEPYREEGAAAGPWAGGIDNVEYPGGNVCAYVGGRGVANYAPTNYVINEVWDGELADDMRNASCNIRRYFVCMDQNHSMYGKPVPYEMLDYTTQKITEFFPIWTKLAPVDDWGYEDLADGGNRSNMYCDQYACRSAETILLRAEANLRAGDKGAAANDVNMLRNRAECSKLATADDMTIQYILDERVRELFGEERRWVTLLRMGADGINSINEHAMYIADQPFWGGFFSASKAKISSWTLFPIPQTVIDTNTGAVIEQNPGW